MTPPLDFVGALIVWLRPQLAVDEKIGAKVPDGPRGKFVLVRRVGGPFEWPVKDQPMVTVEAWAPTHAQAHDLCRKVQSPHLDAVRPQGRDDAPALQPRRSRRAHLVPRPRLGRTPLHVHVIIPYREHMEVA